MSRGHSVFLVAAAVLAVSGLPGVVCDTLAETNKTGSVVRPLVVLKQAEIEGRVYFLTEDEQGKDKKDATNTKKIVKIKVLTEDQSTVLHQTQTDETGRYTIPNLDVGKYKLVVGKLIVDLLVKDRASNPDNKKELPKPLHIFIPEALRD